MKKQRNKLKEHETKYVHIEKSALIDHITGPLVIFILITITCLMCIFTAGVMYLSSFKYGLLVPLVLMISLVVCFILNSLLNYINDEDY